MSLLTKQRTREHVIADLSVNHVERHILLAGYVADRVLADYGYDLIVRTFDEGGHVERGCFFVQLKSSDTLDYNTDGAYVSVRLDRRDMVMWEEESLPVVLIAYDPGREAAYWVHFQALGKRDSLTVRVPVAQRLDADAVRTLRGVKNRVRKETRDADT